MLDVSWVICSVSIVWWIRLVGSTRLEPYIIIGPYGHGVGYMLNGVNVLLQNELFLIQDLALF